MHKEKIVIVGNGIAGITAARYLRKYQQDVCIQIISSESKYFFSRTALMYVYMGHMKQEHTKPYEDWFWKKNNLELIQDTVISIHPDEKHIITEQAGTITYSKLIIASGSKPKIFKDLTGIKSKGVQGLYSLQDLENMETHTTGIKEAVVVGGGLIGIEMAEMLRSRDINVTLLVRESSFWNQVLPKEESQMVNQHILRHGVQLLLQEELTEIITDKHQRVKAVSTSNGKEISCEFVGITIGVEPNIEFVKSSPIETNKGVLVNAFFESSASSVYAIGDCAEFKAPPGSFRKKIEQVWYTGRIHGETLAYSLSKERLAYTPGIWFNSAKFFDIEYQTYGEIYSEEPADRNSLFWQNGQRSIRISFEKNTLIVKGFNLMGIRFRHDTCDKWLRDRRILPEVIMEISKANFDPEFFNKFDEELIQEYNRQFPSNPLPSKKFKKLPIPFLK